jgi:hypothetical protein
LCYDERVRIEKIKMSISTLSPKSSVYESPTDTTDAATPADLAHDLIRICESGKDGLDIEPWRYAEDAINQLHEHYNKIH